MSATPNNAGASWGDSPTAPSQDPGNSRNALQALLAFACIHEQAEKRRKADPATSAEAPSDEESFALAEVLQLVADRALAITGADGVAVALANENAIVCRARAGRIAPDAGVRLDPNSGFSGACLRRGETVRCDDSETDARVNAAACRSLGARSMVAVPLATKQRIVGLIEAFSSDTYGFNDSDVRCLGLLSELILAAIRPEEEDLLAELARKVIPPIAAAVPAPVPQPPKPVAISLTTTAAVASEPPAIQEIVPVIAAKSDAAITPKILVDERSAPTAAAAKPAKAAPAPDNAAPITAPPVLPSTVEPQVASVAVPAVAVKEEKAERIAASLAVPEERRSVWSIAGTAAAVLVVMGLLWAIVWKGQHVGQPISANTQEAHELKPAEMEVHDEKPLPPAVHSATLPLVSAIKHSSSGDSSTIEVDLEDQVEYEGFRLEDPPRIYFDLHDTRLSPSVTQGIEINDSFIKRVRVAQPVEGVTRVVLETKGVPDYSPSLKSDPYRLTIELRKAAPVSAPAALPTPSMPKPSPAITTSPSKPQGTKSGSSSGPPVIVLDPGHGGWDLGTIGKKGLLEKDLALDVVQRLGKLLEAKLGANVIYTRQDDSFLQLEKRAEIANLARANLFLSVHANYSDLPTARGVETYFTRTYSSVKARTDDASLKQADWSNVVDIREKVMDSKRLASDIQQSLYNGLTVRNPDVRNRGIKDAQYVVLTGTQMPAVLAEISFVSSPADEDKLKNSEYRQLIAEALYRGMARYVNDTKATLAKK